MSQLETRGLSVRYGGVRAVSDVDLVVPPGRLVGLIGPNGAGKTTALDAINGVTRSTGQVLVDGVDVTPLPPHARARLGLARVWQSTELFGELTVGQNIHVASERLSVWSAVKDSFRVRSTTVPEFVDQAIDLLDLRPLVDRKPSELSHGQQKLVGVARAVASGARVLLLDEPAAGLDRSESTRLGACLRRIVDTGVAILLIEHDMELVLSVCHDVYVLDWGKVIARGDPEAIQRDAAVQAAYLGRHALAGSEPA